jgi:broad specificity phosphatase PhoE
MTFYLIRHGRKEPGKFFNPALRHQDPPLSEAGREQAAGLVRYFADASPEALYVSEYLRTRQTAGLLAEALGVEPVTDRRLNELDNGLLDDMDEAEFKRAYPEEWKAYDARTADFRFPGGETGQEARDRIADFLEEKRRQHTGGGVIAVSHDGLIRVCMTHILGAPVFHRGDFRVDTAGITMLEFQEDVGRWKLIRFNQTPA